MSPGGSAATVMRSPRRAAGQGLLLVAPALLALGALTLYPTLWVGWLSLQRRIPIFGVERFEGLGNFFFLAYSLQSLCLPMPIPRLEARFNPVHDLVPPFVPPPRSSLESR